MGRGLHLFKTVGTVDLGDSVGCGAFDLDGWGSDDLVWYQPVERFGECFFFSVGEFPGTTS